ncbi:hypothetical protein PIROE2DRAFT_5734 [Piromyces sp. E2]|nr:hypothetical protein PIROE2DRAFT_5734 [Piromyces sp. E2]|eukprot:OUM66991.1 hypothetical protein PIROE2DRAFT_5734 [Piromyces sp. E2]
MDIRSGTMKMSECNITNNYFENGFLSYTNFFSQIGTHNFSKLIFKNNIAKRGTYINFNDVSGRRDIFPTITTMDTYFYNNTALEFGGVFYSNAREEQYIDTRLIFKNCEFVNNTAILGKISYIHDLNHNALFQMDYGVLKQLKYDKNNFVTNPTHITFDNYNKFDTIEMYSGDIIEKEYSCSAYDDYSNKFQINGDLSNIKLEELLLYDLALKGLNNNIVHSKIFGPSKGYCINNSCKFKNIRVVANPGDYLLELKIVSFGLFYAFKENSLSMKIKIKECNESKYIYQDRDGINIKSCYLPVCNPPCINNGECINDNLCECKDKYFRGKTCSELTMAIYFYRENKIIKAGNIKKNI